MKNLFIPSLDKFRDRGPEIMAFFEGSGDHECGVFNFPFIHNPRWHIKCIASVGYGWEHVSVSYPDRCPTWDEMCAVKALFWEPEDCVMQLHPPKSEWVSHHPYTLHLWKPVGLEIPRPHWRLVGGGEPNQK
jgi:hypothetical protein